jgi:hypothetical protein
LKLRFIELILHVANAHRPRLASIRLRL